MVTKIRNIKDLRLYLDELESAWTEDDKRYHGEFEYIEIRTPWFTLGGNTPAFKGYGSADVYFDGGLGLIFQQSKEIHG